MMQSMSEDDYNSMVQDLLDLIETLNKDEQVHGILVQLPLPKHIDTNKIIEAIHPHKACFE